MSGAAGMLAPPTLSEIIRALETTRTGRPEGAFLAQEVADTMCLSVATVGRALRVLKKAGRLVPHSILVENISGRNQRVTAYTILPAKTRGKRR